MKARTPYFYSVLRYIHDIATGEFVNVGVVLLSPREKRVHFKFRKSLGRISEILPDVSHSSFRTVIRGVTQRFESVRKAYEAPLELDSRESGLQEILMSVVPKDDSGLQWSTISSGLSADTEATFARLYERYAGKYDRVKGKLGRTDDDVWRSFKKQLEKRHLLSYFEEKTIHGKNDDVKFDLAWKNGLWHCVEPVSFDLVAADSIREKAQKCAGEIVGVSDASEKFKIYLLLAKPSSPDLNDAFHRAVGILKNVQSVPMEIFLEEDEGKLIDSLGEQIEAHSPHSDGARPH
ncbi:DUF3037 domain-containing protein [Cupriavidus sp. amp6]|uniref:DUF3037 domain-containing protein n=1 Tax=Cupriavidus sp. amp6 TaxID=388051 RepID=UPI00055E2F46|nr:DUF3037 domain-containing protein [Cupriavidus sp. amp6]